MKVPFKRFAGSWRGMDLPDKTFAPAKIRRLGLQLADKKQGPFELQVDWIRTSAFDLLDRNPRHRRFKEW